MKDKEILKKYVVYVKINKSNTLTFVFLEIKMRIQMMDK